MPDTDDASQLNWNMKTKFLVFVTLLVTAGVAFCTGWYLATRAYGRFFMSHAYMDASNRAVQTVRALINLREGKQARALESLELYLDGDMITFHGYDVLKERPPDYAVRAVRLTRDYRAKYPWTNSEPTVAEGLRDVFRLAD